MVLYDSSVIAVLMHKATHSSFPFNPFGQEKLLLARVVHVRVCAGCACVCVCRTCVY